MSTREKQKKKKSDDAVKKHIDGHRTATTSHLYRNTPRFERTNECIELCAETTKPQ